jgi:hypothetical protein
MKTTRVLIQPADTLPILFEIIEVYSENKIAILIYKD